MCVGPLAQAFIGGCNEVGSVLPSAMDAAGETERVQPVAAHHVHRSTMQSVRAWSAYVGRVLYPCRDEMHRGW